MHKCLKKPVIGFAGMSHLGLNSATAAAAKGFDVFAYDANPQLIENLCENRAPIEEPQLTDLMQQHATQLFFTADIRQLGKCDVIYISIDVPTNQHNQSDLTPITQMINQVADVLHEHACLVVLSQVNPGFTRSLRLDKKQLFYQVETLIFGEAVQRALYPERFIVGCANPQIPLPHAYQQFLTAFNCPIFPMRYESAELAKIAINLFLVSSVTTTNVLAEVSQAVGADWNEIIPTLRLDKRIGQHAYLKPGLGIAGGNLERDLQTITVLGEQFAAPTQLIQTWFENSDYQKNWAYRTLEKEVLCVKRHPKIAILGLAYKTNTHSTKNAPSLQLIEKLSAHEVKVHDPIVNGKLIPNIVFCSNIAEAVAQADVLIIMTAWPDYKNIDAQWLQQQMHGNVILDPLQVLNHPHYQASGFKVMTLGK